MARLHINFVRFIFSKSTGIYRFQLFNFQCSICLKFKVSKTTSVFHIPLNFDSPSQATSFILSPHFLLSTTFFKNYFKLFEVYFNVSVLPLTPKVYFQMPLAFNLKECIFAILLSHQLRGNFHVYKCIPNKILSQHMFLIFFYFF